MPRSLYPQGKRHWYPLDGRAPQTVWTRWWREKFPVFAGTRTPDRPAHSPALQIKLCVPQGVHAKMDWLGVWLPMLFNEIISIGWDRRWVRIWKNMIVICFKTLSGHLPAENEKSHENPHIGQPLGCESKPLPLHEGSWIPLNTNMKRAKWW
jgi:hypothetical protein